LIKEKNTITENLWLLAGKHTKFMFDLVEKISQMNTELYKLKTEVEKLKTEVENLKKVQDVKKNEH